MNHGIHFTALLNNTEGAKDKCFLELMRIIEEYYACMGK